VAALRIMNLFVIFMILVVAAFVYVPLVFIPRRRMERRARALSTQHPDAATTSVYLTLRSSLPDGRRKEMDAKIAEMSASGWTFLRATAANPLRTIRSWGGGLNLHFIRVHDIQKSRAVSCDGVQPI